MKKILYLLNAYLVLIVFDLGEGSGAPASDLLKTISIQVKTGCCRTFLNNVFSTLCVDGCNPEAQRVFFYYG